MLNSNANTRHNIRYSRQIIMDEIGKEGQEKLFQAKVLVVGAGGLGCPVLTYLVGAGVGTIGIVDFDSVGLSNLNRQTLYRTEDVGKKKVQAAKETLVKLNEDVTINTYSVRIDVDNIEELIKEYDFIVDALDNFSARYLLSDACYFQKKILFEGAAVSTYGTATTIVPDVTPCYRCLQPVPPADGITPSCSDIGVLGMITGVIGSIQALEVIKVIVGFGKPLYGRMVYFDGNFLELQEFEYEKTENCPICGKNPTILELEQYEIKCKMKIVDKE
ncbi:HesA/MoeB/ThiF family protein [Alkalibaculum sporogenes]|uniref:HesA/MoeB/ThiF family protein n=1 Tax=Alkalibaculum sporogenes TaxID=2655001 RepID=UPI001FEC85B6|nr:HesA/MoeB/ThiF family protein [Alkalibaculum sporogenes]